MEETVRSRMRIAARGPLEVYSDGLMSFADRLVSAAEACSKHPCKTFLFKAFLSSIFSLNI